MRIVALPLIVAALGGCAKERPLAPTEMVDLVRYMFANWEDEEAMAAAVDNIDPWMQGNADTEESDEGYRLDPLGPDDVSSIDHPDAQLADLLGAAGGAVSDFSVKAQAGHIVLADQTFSNPGQYKVYVRKITEGSANEFKKGEGLIRTLNDIETSTLGVTIPYQLHKDYRWVQGEDAEAIVGRSWVEEISCSDSGKNCLRQSFSIDLFQADSGHTLRLTATWSEVESSVNLSDDILVASLAGGLQNVFDATEEFLADD